MLKVLQQQFVVSFVLKYLVSYFIGVYPESRALLLCFALKHQARYLPDL